MSVHDRPVVATDETFAHLVSSRTPFRTEPKTGRDGERYEDGNLAGYTLPRMLPWVDLTPPNYSIGIEMIETGMLIDQAYSDFAYDWELGWTDYIIYSYDTPIAWHVRGSDEVVKADPEHWVIPDLAVSQSTSKHQMRVIIALKESGEM